MSDAPGSPGLSAVALALNTTRGQEIMATQMRILTQLINEQVSAGVLNPNTVKELVVAILSLASFTQQASVKLIAPVPGRTHSAVQSSFVR